MELKREKIVKSPCETTQLDELVFNPTKSIERRTSSFFMNRSQTKPVRKFSAISTVTPRSMPITSGLSQPVSGLKASRKPYLKIFKKRGVF